MTNQAHAKRQPLLVLVLILALLPIFTFTSISKSAAAGPIDLLEGNLGVDFSIDKWTETGGFNLSESADKLFDGPTVDPREPILTKYYANGFHDEDGINIVFDFGITTSRFEGIGATIRGVQLASADTEGRDPTAWTLEGSNDSTTAWTLIHSSNETETASTLPTERDTNYEPTMFPTSEPFRFFRFIVTANRANGLGNSDSALSSLRFFGGPTVIRTQEELMAIGNDETSLSGDYVLGNDIVLDDTEPDMGYYIGDGNTNTTFTGNFDGGNHTISNLLGTLFQIVGDGGTPTSITHLNLSTAEVGLPASYTGILTEQLSELSSVSDVHVSGKLVQGEECPVGGIAGRGKNDSSIENSSADVTIELGATNDDAGGLIGSTSGNISNSFAKVIISGDAVGKVGGLVGTAEQGSTIINSASSGTIDGGGPNQGTYFGGLVGYSQGATVTQSFSSVSITTGQDSIVGGLVGWAENSPDDSTSTLISNSFASGSVTNQGDKAGGLIGYIDKGTVSNSVATGDVSGILNVGGLIGYAESSIIFRSSAQGAVVGSMSGSQYVGGLVGHISSSGESRLDSSNASGPVSVNGTGGDSIGGLVGFIDSAQDTEYNFGNLIATGPVTAPASSNVGGLIGTSNNRLYNVKATGVVTASGASFSIGGLVGHSAASISQARASGVVSASQGTDVGGLVGYTESDLFQTIFEVGVVTGEINVGTLAGRADPDHISCSMATGTSNIDGPARDPNGDLVIVDGIQLFIPNPLEGSMGYISNDLGCDPIGPTTSTSKNTVMEELNYFDSPPDPLPWDLLPNINHNQPYLQALLSSGFYLVETPSFDLAYSAGEHGSISGNDSQTVNSGESGTAVTAVAASGYHFVKWSDNNSTQNPRIDTNVVGAITAIAVFEADVTSSPVVSSAPVMDPQQDSVISKAVALLEDNGKSNQIVVKGSFPSEIRNVSINGKYLPREDWKQSEGQLLISYDVSKENVLLVQVWNARVPLLNEIKVELVPPTPSATPTPSAIPTPSATPTPTPTPSATPTPSPSPTAKTVISVSKKKKVFKTVICYRGKLVKKVRASKPICPKGYKLRKY